MISLLQPPLSNIYPLSAPNSLFLSPPPEEGLLSGLSVLDRWIFLLDSPHHSLGDMEDWMQRATCCTRSKVNPQYLVTCPQGAAAAMLLRWTPASPFRGELSVHAR